MTRHRELMRLHVEALFTHDANGDLLRVNEPDGAPAPRFFLGRTVDGPLWRFRHDVDDALRRELLAAAEEDVLGKNALDALDPSRYEELLARSAPVLKTWIGPAFCFPHELPATTGTTLVTNGNAHVLRALLDAWFPDVPLCQPMTAVVADGQAVAVCCSGRRTGLAHEAAVETAAAHRGRGYAGHAVAAWARAVREMERVPLYSTSWRNEASRAVARKLALIHFGSDLHIT